MTRKDYEKFAYLLATVGANMRDDRDMNSLDVFEAVMYGVEDLFKADNPRFDRDKYRAYVLKQMREM